MVKKLFKHEFLAWLRVTPIIFGITLAVAALLRLVVAMENDSVYYNIVLSSGIIVFYIGMLATLATPTVFGIVRFYKNLFTGEGYLTHTLPVTPANHLWVKLTTAVVFDICAFLVVVLSVMIATAGEVFTEIWKAGAYLCKQIPKEFTGHIAGWLAEYSVLALVSAFSSHLVFYLCICVGQLSRKNRILAAVGMYFGLYFATQIISTVLTVVLSVLGASGALANIGKWIGENPEAFIHTLLSGLSVIAVIISGIYFLICHYILRKKLNLE